MKVSVYVEGPSDQTSLSALLKPIIEMGKSRGVGVRFLPQGGKATLLHHVPHKAVDILRQNPNDWVFALPDLYPMAVYDKTDDAHRSFRDLDRMLRHKFTSYADKLGMPETARSHFRIHCLKHDLEALLLATPDVLRRRLGTRDALRNQWRLPVEDQNDDKPPKRIVEELFRRYRKKPDYIDTTDALWILGRAPLDDVVKACPQRFAPFVSELRALAEGRDPSAVAEKPREQPTTDALGSRGTSAPEQV